MSGIPLGLAIIAAGNPVKAWRAIHRDRWCLGGVISSLRASRTRNGAAMSRSPFGLLTVPGRDPAGAGWTQSACRRRFGGRYPRRNRNPIAMSRSPFGLLTVPGRNPAPPSRTGIPGGRGGQVGSLLGCRRQRYHSDNKSTRQIKHIKPHFVLLVTKLVPHQSGALQKIFERNMLRSTKARLKAVNSQSRSAHAGALRLAARGRMRALSSLAEPSHTLIGRDRPRLETTEMLGFLCDRYAAKRAAYLAAFVS